MAQVVTRMIASRGCSIFGSGTSSQRMSVGLCQTRAFIGVLLAVDAVNPPELARVPPDHAFVRAPPGLAFTGGKAQLEGATQGRPRYAFANGRVGVSAMETKWSVLAALRAGREQVRLGTSDGAIGAIRSLRGEVPAPVRDQAYYALMDTATRTGEPPSMATLAGQRDETLALFDVAIGQLAAKLH